MQNTQCHGEGHGGGGTTNSAPDPTAYRDVCVWSV